MTQAGKNAALRARNEVELRCQLAMIETSPRQGRPRPPSEREMRARREAQDVRRLIADVRDQLATTAEMLRTLEGEVPALVRRMVDGGRRRQHADEPAMVVVGRALAGRDPVGEDVANREELRKIGDGLKRVMRVATSMRAATGDALDVAREVNEAGSLRRCWDCGGWFDRLKARGQCRACYQKHWRHRSGSGA